MAEYPKDNEQRRRPTIQLPKQAHDIEGQRFGELVALRPVEVGRYGVVWECRCDCGRFAERTTGSLNYTRRQGGTSCCRECACELHGGRVHEARQHRREALLRLWKKTGSLYSIEAEQYLASMVAQDLEREFGYITTGDNETWAQQQVRRYGRLSVDTGQQWRPPNHYEGTEDVGPYQKAPEPEPITARPELVRRAGPDKEYRETIDRMRRWLALERHKDRIEELGQDEARDRERDAFIRSLWESDGPIIINI